MYVYLHIYIYIYIYICYNNNIVLENNFLAAQMMHLIDDIFGSCFLGMVWQLRYSIFVKITALDIKLICSLIWWWVWLVIYSIHGFLRRFHYSNTLFSCPIRTTISTEIRYLSSLIVLEKHEPVLEWSSARVCEFRIPVIRLPLFSLWYHRRVAKA